MKPMRRTYLAVLGALVALIVVLIAIAAIGADRTVPERAIASPAPAFKAQTMYVSPGEYGRSSGGDESADDQEEAKSDQQVQQEQEPRGDEPTEPADAGFAPEGGGNNGSGSNGNNGNPASDDRDGDSDPKPDRRDSPPSDPDRDPDDPPRPGTVIPGISTNLMNYTMIGAGTKSPDRVSLTLEGKSGLDRLTRKLVFYAIPSDAVGGYSVLVEYANDGTGGQKQQLAGSGGLFELPVVLADGAATDVALTLVDRNGARTNRVAEYRVVYEGREGPIIELANLEDGQRFLQSPAQFSVAAHDRYDGSAIYSEHISVTVEGAGRAYRIEPQGSRSPYEYAIDFDSFVLEGDDNTFTVTVEAWDYSVEQASTTLTRSIVYEHHPYGEVIGQATIVIDATPVGLGIVESFAIDLHQGYLFPQDLVEGLEDAGLRPEYSGSPDGNFYLRGIAAGGLFAGQSLDDELMHKIEQDKITYTGSHGSDALAEHDWTGASGWLYNVNDSWWPSVSLDGYTAAPGDTVYLVFSVGDGKDVGAPSSSGGALSSYCGLWRGGTYTELHDISEYKVVKEPTCSEEGEARYECSVRGCGAWGSEIGAHANGEKIVLPATGEHTWIEDPLNSEEPADGQDGVRAYVCAECGETKTEVWPWEGTWPPDDPDPEPEPGSGDDPDPEPEPGPGDDPDPEPEPGDDPDPDPESDAEPEPEPDAGGGNAKSAALKMQAQAAKAFAFICAMDWRAA